MLSQHLCSYYPPYSIITCKLTTLKIHQKPPFKKSLCICPTSCDFSLLDLHILFTSVIYHILLHIIVICTAYFPPLHCKLSEDRDIIFISPAINELMMETLFSVCWSQNGQKVLYMNFSHHFPNFAHVFYTTMEHLELAKYSNTWERDQWVIFICNNISQCITS